MSKCKILLVEDNDSNRAAISRALEKIGFSVKAFSLGEPAIKHLDSVSEPTILISDIRLPDTSGLDILKKAKELETPLSVILITGYGSIEDAVEAMKLGADDYLTKPLDLYKLRKQVESLSQKRELAEEVDHLKQRLDKRYGMESIIGNSEAMERVFEQIRLVAPTRSTVLITGDSGTGKELVANSIHQLSPRKDNRFLPLNCAAIAPNLLESELFGHEKGAFTGATQRRVGKFELADNGTIFLDEISEINPDIQVKLLRVLEEMEFMRLGGSDMIKVDVRVIAATNRNLEKMVEEGTFREDLYYRLKVVSIKLPSLRERRDDIPMLVDHFINHFSSEHGKTEAKISSDALEVLVNHEWKGNVRELRNLIESVLVLTPDGEIGIENLPSEYRNSSTIKSQSVVSFNGMTMEEIEKRAIYEALEKTDGNRTKAAKLLGIGLRTLQRKLKDYQAEEKREEKNNSEAKSGKQKDKG